MKVGLDSGVLVASVKKRGEIYHDSCVVLSGVVSSPPHSAVASALTLTEVPGALASSTSMPVEKIYMSEVSIQEYFTLNILPFEPYVERTVDLMFEFRDLKRRLGIGSADFHHIATGIDERCDLFVTTDKRHLLNDESRHELGKYIRIVDPDEALELLEPK